MIDGAWNHHPSLVLRNELLTEYTSKKQVLNFEKRAILPYLLSTHSGAE